MPTTIDVEVKDDGSIGTLPEPLQKFLDSKIKEAFGKGAAKTAEEAKAQMEAAVEQARKEAREEAARSGSKPDPADREKLKNLELELSKAKEQDALREKNFEEAQRLRDERHQKELKEREDQSAKTQAEVERRTKRIRELVTSEIRVAAIQAGARDESIPELNVLLSQRIDLDDDLQAFVKDATDPSKPALDEDGDPVTIEGLVTQYLADHPHHKATAPAKPGGARGGQSLTGQKQTKAEAEQAAALDDLSKEPSIESAARMIGVIRRQAAS